MCGKKLRSEGLTFPSVGLDLRVPEPGAQLVQGREVVLDLSERRRPPAPWQGLEQLGRPSVGLSRAVPDYIGSDIVVQEEIIDAGRQLSQAVGHGVFFSEGSWRLIHS